MNIIIAGVYHHLKRTPPSEPFVTTFTLKEALAKKQRDMKKGIGLWTIHVVFDCDKKAGVLKLQIDFQIFTNSIVLKFLVDPPD